jgi:pimeloyl-ACP methyl ester carboxylesterase
MQHMIRTRDASLAAQSFGHPADPPLLLVMGATASMLGWPDALCTALAAHGLHVIRFDHRDTGRSTTCPPGTATYPVEDMAADLIAILDHFSLPAAHLAGLSLGGYLAQMAALDHPDRVLSLTLIASEPLGWDGAPLPHLSDAVLGHFGSLATLDWQDRAAVTVFLLTLDRLCAGSVQPFDASAARARITEVLARTDSPASMFNHASLASRTDWTGRFRTLACPTLVLHGSEDPVLPPANAAALAQGIPGARLHVLTGMGHDLPAALQPDFARLIADHVLAAGRAP